MRVYKRLSSRHGYGLFAGQFIPKNTPIILAFTQNQYGDCQVTDNGKLINHSIKPNTYLHKVKHEYHNDYYIISSQDIYNGNEITSNYYDTPDCIIKPDASYALSI